MQHLDMNFNRRLVVLFLSLSGLLCVGVLRGQAAEFPTLLARVGDAIMDVETAKYGYEQSFVSNADQPWRATFTKAEINLKNGKTTTVSYAFNLADFDTKLIRVEDSRTELLLSLKTSRAENLIQVEEDGERENYVAEIEIHMADIDQARALEEYLEAAIPLATRAWEAAIQTGTTAAELHNWLAENIVAVAIDDERVDQFWTADASRPELVVFSQTEIDAKGSGEERTYRFNLADLAKNAVELDIRGDRMRVGVATIGKADFILAAESEGKTQYTDAFYIEVADVDAARLLLRTLQAAIPLAEAATESRLPRPENLADGLTQLAAITTGAQTEDEVIRLSLSPEILTTLTEQRGNLDGSKENSTRYLFHFGDLAAAKVEIVVKGDAITLQLETRGGENYIQHWENGESDGYTDEVSLAMPTIEQARVARYLAQFVIEAAGQTEVAPADLAWLQRALARSSSTELRQSLEPGTGDCEWEFTRIESGGKTDEETLYVLNLYDLDPRLVNFDVSTKAVVLKLATLHGEKIINVYENGKPGFTNEMKIQLSNLDDAKRAKATAKILVEGCKS